jgi:hypothetical protein
LKSYNSSHYLEEEVVKREKRENTSSTKTMAEAEQQYSFPPFDDLPKVEGMPQGNTRGFFDKDGKKDEVGS